MRAPSSAIVLERFTEAHAEGVTALYNVPAVARQVLQMPFQSPDIWRKRLDASNERLVSLVALHEGTVVGQGSLEQFSRIRRSHCGSIGMAVAQDWQGRGIGKQLLTALLDIADNWMKTAPRRVDGLFGQSGSGDSVREAGLRNRRAAA